MKVYELVKKLNEYNPNADIDVVVNGFSKEFEIYFGGSEGCQPYNCDCVDLTVDTPCEEEGSETTVDIKIEDMDLSVRSYNCLKRAGLNSLSQLSKLSYEDFANIRNLGKRNVDEIIDKLKYYGYEIARRW